MQERKWKRFARNRGAVVGLGILVLFLLFAVLAPVIAPQNPNKTHLRASLAPPSRDALLGRDQLGRDVLSRIIYGARTSFLIGASATAAAALVGVLLGLVAGYYSGVRGEIIMRIVDIMLAFPEFLVALVVVGILGPGFYNVLISIAIVFVPRFVRITRASALSVRENDYIQAAVAIGAGNGRMIFAHVLPNCLAPAIVQGTLLIGDAILISAGLGFLGLGAQPPLAEWGAMLSDGRGYIATAPHIATFPGLAIMFMVIGFNLVGDSLRDTLDVRLT